MCLTCHSIAVVWIAAASGCVCYAMLFTNENSVCCSIDLAFSRIWQQFFIGSSFHVNWIHFSFPVHSFTPAFHSFCWFFFTSFFSVVVFSSAVFVYRETCAFFIQWLWIRPSTCRRWCSLFLWRDCSACVCVFVRCEYEWVMWNASKINLVRMRWNGKKSLEKIRFKCATTKIVAREIHSTSARYIS